MKRKVKIMLFLVLLMLVASSTLVSAKEEEKQNVIPQVVKYCTTPSGLHEGHPANAGGLDKFYDKSKLPGHVFYPGLFTSYTCSGCGETVYIYSYTGQYSGSYCYSNAISYDDLFWVFGYRMIDPNFVYPGTPAHWQFYMY